MSMTVDYNFIILLLSIQRNLYRIGGPILIVLGTISSILSIIVFTRKNLRKNPCTIYFLAFNAANIIYICASFLSPTLIFGYNINHTAQNIHLCRTQLYMGFVFNCLCPFYLILASIDRVLITSSNASTRQRSTRRLAYKTIIIGTLCFLLLTIPILVAAGITGSEVTGLYCTIQPGYFSTTIIYISLAKETITPLLMIIFGLWSVRNIHRLGRNRVVPNSSVERTHTTEGTQKIQSKDHQLILMLLIDISIYIIFNTIMPVVLIYTNVTPHMTKTLEQTVVDALISAVAIYSVQVPFCVTSYAYLLISKTFRNELKNIILCQ